MYCIDLYWIIVLRYKYLIMKKILFITAVLFSVVSCSSDDDSGELPEGKHIKITVQATGLNVEDMDYLSVVVAGANASPSENTIWKINGETQNNQVAVGVSDSDIEIQNGEVVVFETISPVMTGGGSFQVINFDAPFNFKYKAEVNGEVVVNIDETISDTRSEQYQF